MSFMTKETTGQETDFTVPLQILKLRKKILGSVSSSLKVLHMYEYNVLLKKKLKMFSKWTMSHSKNYEPSKEVLKVSYMR